MQFSAQGVGRHLYAVVGKDDGQVYYSGTQLQRSPTALALLRSRASLLYVRKIASLFKLNCGCRWLSFNPAFFLLVKQQPALAHLGASLLKFRVAASKPLI